MEKRKRRDADSADEAWRAPPEARDRRYDRERRDGVREHLTGVGESGGRQPDDRARGGRRSGGYAERRGEAHAEGYRASHHKTDRRHDESSASHREQRSDQDRETDVVPRIAAGMHGRWRGAREEFRIANRLAGRVAGRRDRGESAVEIETLTPYQGIGRQEVLGLVAGRGDPSGGPPAGDKVDRQQQREERARGRIHQE